MFVMKYFFLSVLICTLHVNSTGQSKTRILYIIDSIPILDDPEPLDKLLLEDISDSSTLTEKDRIQSLGWNKMTAIVYLFTKAYRSRPDSIKQIPNLKQMVLKDGIWMHHQSVYTGKFRKYFLNGHLQSEGNLLNGKVEGRLVNYFKNGAVKSISYFTNGMKQGAEIVYYKNGKILRKTTYVDNRQTETNSYFINGQLQDEFKTGLFSKKDSLIQYYSTGKIRNIKIAYKNGFAIDRKTQKIKEYTTLFYGKLLENKINEANNILYLIRKLDSNSIETIFMEGVTMVYEFRFKKAIELFDKALSVEPLMGDALAQRAIARIKLFKYIGIPLHAVKEERIEVDDLKRMPVAEQTKVCSDIIMADFLDTNLEFVFNNIPGEILQYCKMRN